MKNRITELLGVKYPIVQAPMGWIARADLASAVSNAGAMGIIFPMIRSAADAETAVRAVRYPPAGERAAIFLRAADLLSGPWRDRSLQVTCRGPLQGSLRLAL